MPDQDPLDPTNPTTPNPEQEPPRWLSAAVSLQVGSDTPNVAAQGGSNEELASMLDKAAAQLRGT